MTNSSGDGTYTPQWPDARENATKVPRFRPLWEIKKEEEPFKMPFQWLKCIKMPSEVSRHLKNFIKSKVPFLWVHLIKCPLSAGCIRLVWLMTSQLAGFQQLREKWDTQQNSIVTWSTISTSECLTSLLWVTDSLVSVSPTDLRRHGETFIGLHSGCKPINSGIMKKVTLMCDSTANDRNIWIHSEQMWIRFVL